MESPAVFEFVADPSLGKYNQPLTVDEDWLTIVDRKLRASRVDHDYFVRTIPMTSVARIDIERQTRGQRVRRGLLRFIMSAAFLGFLWLILQKLDRLFIVSTLLAIFGLLCAIPSCFLRRSTFVIFVVDGRRHRFEMTAKRWDAEGRELIHILTRSPAPCYCHGMNGDQVQWSIDSDFEH